ncbi:unnamed protein product [Arabidopsis halleri]
MQRLPIFVLVFVYPEPWFGDIKLYFDGWPNQELNCKEWLMREDSVTYSRDFTKDPIFITGGEKDFQWCSVDCTFGDSSGKKPDAAFGLGHQPGTLSIIRSMESAQYYPENDIAQARRWTLHDSVLIRWKYEGPSDSFKALVDMAAVHSSCRLCIFLATRVREQEEKGPNFKKRPCKCTRGGSDTLYHVFVRERGRFEMESIFLRGKSLTQEALESAVLAKIHRIYPLGLTQRQALYKFKFEFK